MAYMAYHGAKGWHMERWPETPRERILGRRLTAERLCAGIMAYQTWDFCASASLPSHRNFIFLAHHVAAALTAYLTLEYQMMHTYSLFYGGCSEISTLALVWIDLDKYFPAAQNGAPAGSAWQTFIVANQGLFVLLFVSYRLIGWIGWSVPLWRDTFYVLQQKDTKHYRPGQTWFLYVFLAMDIALGSLQVYWFVYSMLPKIVEVVQGAKE